LPGRTAASVIADDIGFRDDANAQAVVDAIPAAGGEAVASADVVTRDGAGVIVQCAIDSFGRIDLVVNKATAGRFGDLRQLPEGDEEPSVSVNSRRFELGEQLQPERPAEELGCGTTQVSPTSSSTVASTRMPCGGLHITPVPLQE
jgi:NAD(P)-dependent dehydrogenase (short-subunit alcohol dehydrogenase family)